MLNYFRMDEGSRVALLQEEYPEELALIDCAATRLAKARNRGELGCLIAKELESFSLFDLQLIGGRLQREISRLPYPYREAVRPYFIEQLFGMHHRLLLLYRSGELERMNSPISDPELFTEFLRMIPAGCFSWDDQWERNSCLRNPKNRLFYYLISAFTMFVLGQPGHPVGMPFPGGFSVEQRRDGYYCLIRDKEKDVVYSICNFCPAKQAEE